VHTITCIKVPTIILNGMSFMAITFSRVMGAILLISLKLALNGAITRWHEFI
jgi:hypothetical protein